jgi:hypothetical protein
LGVLIGAKAVTAGEGIVPIVKGFVPALIAAAKQKDVH